jgi:hypothetical protein
MIQPDERTNKKVSQTGMTNELVTDEATNDPNFQPQLLAYRRDRWNSDLSSEQVYVLGWDWNGSVCGTNQRMMDQSQRLGSSIALKHIDIK